jgi:hypothetical protein
VHKKTVQLPHSCLIIRLCCVTSIQRANQEFTAWYNVTTVNLPFLRLDADCFISSVWNLYTGHSASVSAVSISWTVVTWIFSTACKSAWIWAIPSNISPCWVITVSPFCISCCYRVKEVSILFDLMSLVLTQPNLVLLMTVIQQLGHPPPPRVQVFR